MPDYFNRGVYLAEQASLQATQDQIVSVGVDREILRRFKTAAFNEFAGNVALHHLNTDDAPVVIRMPGDVYFEEAIDALPYRSARSLDHDPQDSMVLYPSKQMVAGRARGSGLIEVTLPDWQQEYLFNTAMMQGVLQLAGITFKGSGRKARRVRQRTGGLMKVASANPQVIMLDRIA